MRRLAGELVEGLSSIGNLADAAALAVQYLADLDNGVSLLPQAREWSIQTLAISDIATVSSLSMFSESQFVGVCLSEGKTARQWCSALLACKRGRQASLLRI